MQNSLEMLNSCFRSAHFGGSGGASRGRSDERVEGGARSEAREERGASRRRREERGEPAAPPQAELQPSRATSDMNDNQHARL